MRMRTSIPFLSLISYISFISIRSFRVLLFTVGMASVPVWAQSSSQVSNLLFPLKEQLHYQVTWNGIPVGESFLAINGTILYEGKMCYILQSGGRSTGTIGHLFPVAEITTSYWDPENMRTLFYRRTVIDANKQTHYHVHMNYEAMEIRGLETSLSRNLAEDAGSNKIKNRRRRKKEPNKWRYQVTRIKESIPAGESVNDPLSLLYLQRLLPIINNSQESPQKRKNHQKYELSVFANNQMRRISLQETFVGPRRLDLKVNGAKQEFQTMVLQPNPGPGGFFDAKEASTVWILQDHRRWPLKIETKLPIGTMVVQLVQQVSPIIE